MEQKEEGYFTYFAKVDKVYRKLCSQAVAEYDFTPNEILVMMFLANNPDLNSASDIAHYRNISKSLVAKSVDSLCEKGYLVTGKDRRDRRLVHLYLTAKSDEIVKRLKDSRRNFLQRLYEGVSPEDKEALGRASAVMNRNLTSILNGGEGGKNETGK